MIDQHAARQRRLAPFTRRLTLCVLLVNLFVVVLAALWLGRSRQQYEDTAHVVTRNLTQVLANQIGESIGKADIALRAVMDEYARQHAAGRIDAAALNAHIERARARLPEIDALRITAADGALAYGTGVAPGPAVSLADRPHFIRLRDDAQAGLVFSRPQVSRVNNQWVMVLARRIGEPGEAFGGMAFAAIRLDHLAATFARLDVGPHGVTALRDDELGIIARHPLPAGSTGEIGNKQVAPELHVLIDAGKTDGSFRAVAGLDQVERVYSFRRIAPYPLYAFVGLAGEDYLAPWRTEAGRVAALLALFALATLSSSRLLDRAWKRLTASNAALVQQEAKFRTVADYTHDWEMWTAPGGEVLYISPSCERISGYGRAEFEADPTLLARLVLPEDQALWRRHVERQGDPAGLCEMVVRIRRPDGDICWLEHRCNPVTDGAGRYLGRRSSNRDISARRHAEEQLRLAHVAFTNSDEAIVVTDQKALILDVNPAFTRITGYSRTEAVGQNPRILQSGRQDGAFYQGMWRALVQSGRWEGEFCNRRKNGEFYLQHAKITAVRDDDGRIVRYVAVAADVTELKESQGRIEYLAYHDPLTNLPNRTLLSDRLRQAIAQADRHKNLLAVCYLDLDGFKPVNDTWGHDLGDLLLIEAGRRLHSCLRAGDTVARLGGDEFVVLLGDAKDVREVEQTMQRILSAIAAPFNLGTVETALTASIGLTIYPHDGPDPDTLIRHADQAMYTAKQAGKNRFQMFDSAGDRRLRARMEVVERVQEGLAAGEFCLYYQPKVDMRRGVVVGVEALLRWHHPHQGLLAPGMFLPIVEATDFSITLGEWVLAQALRQLASWAERGLVLPVSINISGSHLQRPEFLPALSRLLKQFPQVKPEWVELEILETTAMDDIDRVSGIIAACSALGVSFALDDFGTGYSSLTYFRRLPTHLLKIDQSFVRDMLDDPDDLSIVEGVIGLAHTFQRQVIAEGVETIEHGVPLMHFGCDLAQGYAIARPMPAAEIPAWIDGWQVPAAWQQMAAVRWSRDDFPLLLAEIHHRRWIDRMADICQGTASIEMAPPLGTHQCRFGQWLYGIGKKRYGKSAAFKALAPIHDKVHALGSELLALAGSNRAEASARIAELYAVRDELEKPLEQMKRHVGVEEGPH